MNQGRPIFRDDHDRQEFIETLGEACAKTGWLIRACVLMGNPHRLLLQTPGLNLVAGMKWLQGTYIQRYNRRHHRPLLFGGVASSSLVLRNVN